MSGAVQGARSAGFWVGLFLASVAAVVGLKVSGAIEGGTAYLLFLVPTVLLVPLYRATQRCERAKGSSSPAVVRYNRGALMSSLAYVLGLGVAMWVWRNLEPSTEVTWLLAMLPIVPVLAFVYVMGRYIVEEADEYLRHRATMASLVGLGLVLAFGSFWGFLETFELVPHVPGWWTVPVWALGMGLAQAWMSWRAA
jgi:hypothetical protein